MSTANKTTETLKYIYLIKRKNKHLYNYKWQQQMFTVRAKFTVSETSTQLFRICRV